MATSGCEKQVDLRKAETTATSPQEQGLVGQNGDFIAVPCIERLLDYEVTMFTDLQTEDGLIITAKLVL